MGVTDPLRANALPFESLCFCLQEDPREEGEICWPGLALTPRPPQVPRGQGHRTGGSSAPATRGPCPHECRYGGQTRARGLQAGSAHPFTCARSFLHREVFILLYRRGHGGPGRWADCPRAPGARLTPPRPPLRPRRCGRKPQPAPGPARAQTLDPEGQLQHRRDQNDFFGGAGAVQGGGPAGSCLFPPLPLPRAGAPEGFRPVSPASADPPAMGFEL